VLPARGRGRAGPGRQDVGAARGREPGRAVGRFREAARGA
jgi:hypothetical protein